jgi:hypothetical protein
MTKMKKLLELLVIALILTGCDAITGKEVGRLQINKLSTEGNLVIKETTLDLKKDEEIGIWSDMDIEYEGDVAMRFRVEIWKHGKKVNGFEIDPTDKNVTMGEVKTTVMGNTDWSFTGRNTAYKIDEDGQYTFKGTLVASDNSSLKVTKAEIVFKK